MSRSDQEIHGIGCMRYRVWTKGRLTVHGFLDWARIPDGKHPLTVHAFPMTSIPIVLTFPPNDKHPLIVHASPGCARIPNDKYPDCACIPSQWRASPVAGHASPGWARIPNDKYPDCACIPSQ
eukprot:1162051-Pelagomonas_calceolata.AAC.10